MFSQSFSGVAKYDRPSVFVNRNLAMPSVGNPETTAIMHQMTISSTGVSSGNIFVFLRTVLMPKHRRMNKKAAPNGK